ncbi:uncharacterized protein LODBEIA_P59100 [Lodderomyces beijingensis]|uniref:ATPase expression protein 1 n=1 Tax=Lodderomyces beijingensis TaxID=1775926 RepID=A0ABP0ZW60_9ASCO
MIVRSRLRMPPLPSLPGLRSRSKLRVRFNSQIRTKFTAQTHGMEIQPQPQHGESSHSITQQQQSSSSLLDEEQAKYANHVFQWMMSSKHPYSQVYEFACSHYRHLTAELLVTFTYNLLLSGHLKPAISLQHLLKDHPNYQIPNQLWTLIIARVCSRADHLGAVFIYHELIDNYQFYDEVSVGVQDNHLISFLVSESILQQLGIILANNSEYAKLTGILRYFRRFYSFAFQEETYRSLLILVVEAYAQAGLFKEAMNAFNSLAHACMEYRFPLRIRPHEFHAILSDHVKRREKNIAENQEKLEFEPKQTLDIHQSLLCQICHSDIYNPVIFRNSYASSRSDHNPVIVRSIAGSDLPKFTELITEHFESNWATVYDGDVDRILHSINGIHPAISTFVVSTLCRLRHPSLAFDLMKALGNKTTRRMASRNQNFITVLRSISGLNQQADHSLARAVVDYHAKVRKGHTNLEVLKTFIVFLLRSPETTASELERNLRKLQTYRGDLTIRVSRGQYEKFRKLIKADTFNEVMILDPDL